MARRPCAAHTASASRPGYCRRCGWPTTEHAYAPPMPHVARKAARGWAVVNKRTGKTVGRSSTKAKAASSARARDAAAHGWQPTKGKGTKGKGKG